MKLRFKKKSALRLLCALLALSLPACEYEEDFPAGVGEGNIEAIVLNEGRIGTNMGAISVLYRNGMVSPDVFRAVNGRPLGDVAQSLTLINGKYFITLNNSKKIEIVDPATFRSEGTILYTQAGLPRQMVAISDTTAIVSDLLSNNGSGTDLPGQLVRIRTVPPYGAPPEYIVIRRWVEYMEVAAGKLFGMTSKGLYVFDLDDISQEGSRMIEEVYNEEITKTCKMLKDKSGRIWALMNERDKGRLTGVLLKCIDPVTEKVVNTCRLPFVNKSEAEEGDVVGAVGYNRTDMDATRTLIYFSVRTHKPGRPDDSQQSIYTLNTDDGTFSLHRHVPGVDMMYGCGVSPRGEVYICDCLDYSAQRGYVRHYKENGNIESFRVGVYPNQVYFPETIEAQ